MPDVVEDGAFAAAAAAAATFADDVVDVAVAVTVAAFGRAEGDDGDAARTRAVRRGAGLLLLLRRREARLANSCTPIRDPRRLLCPRFDAAFGLVSRPCGTPPS